MDIRRGTGVSTILVSQKFYERWITYTRCSSIARDHDDWANGTVFRDHSGRVATMQGLV